MADMTAAHVDTVVDTVFGQRLADPYRWMERCGPELHEWLDAQADHAARYLEDLPDRAAMVARVAELTSSAVRMSGFALAGERVFFLRHDADADVPVMVVREGADQRVLLDPAVFTGDEHYHLDWHVPSPDGTRVAFGISGGGSEHSVLRVLDVATGELHDTMVPGTRHGVVSWLPDASGFVYHRYRSPSTAAPEQRRHDSATYLHVLDGRADIPVLARTVNEYVTLAPTDRPFVLLPASSAWMIAVISHSALAGTVTEGMSDCTIYAAPRSALVDPATCPWRRIADPADGVTAFAVHCDTLYAVSHRRAPRSEVLAWSLVDGRVSVVVPGGERAIRGVLVAGDHLLVHDIECGISRLRRVPLEGGEVEEVPLPIDGSILEWTSHPDGSSALLVLSSWTRSPAAYRYDGRLYDTDWIPPSPVDFGNIEVHELRATARDGVQVPLTVLHRTGLALDGANPTLLTGYGSYGYVFARAFTPELLAWLERGGVYARAGLRGGGECGREWHEAGRRTNKERTITDLIDCAEHLVAAGYTRPGRLAADGISAGGIPTGGALVRRPDLWAAMVMQVPATNLTRQEFSENGPINIPEFGSVATEEGLRDLLIIDSYLRVTDGTPYPAVLLTAGLNDPRVAIWQPAKMAARLQAASSSNRPVLLRVDRHAGHGYGSTRVQNDRLVADVFAFVLAHLTDCVDR
jgi:prolyl oligopeptidase